MSAFALLRNNEGALYAESENDAKARAEAAIRSHGDEQPLEDSGPALVAQAAGKRDS